MKIITLWQKKNEIIEQIKKILSFFSSQCLEEKHQSAYHETAFVHWGGCDSRLRSLSACVCIALSVSYSPPSGSTGHFREILLKSRTIFTISNMRLDHLPTSIKTT